MSKILIADAIDAVGVELLKTQGHDVMVAFDMSHTELLGAIGDVDALVVRSRTKVTAEVIEKGKSLKVIARAGAGVDNIDVAAAREHHIVVVNAPGATTEAVAEHTIALVLSLVRNIPSISHALAQGKWEKSSYTAGELKGKVLGIVGFGHIGSRVAQLGRAFGMKALAATRNVRGDMQKEIDALGGRFVSLEELLKQSDVISVHVPATKETQGFIGSDQLALLKPTAYLVNTARASVIDEAALVSVLKENKIAGAALDVFAAEPLPGESPLLDLHNVILTPHVASVSPEGKTLATMMVCQDVHRVLGGESATHTV